VAVVTLVCFGCNLAYACFYSDIFKGVMPSLGFSLPRWLCCVIFSAFPTMPLCLLKDFSALAPSSFFAVLAVLYTLVVMIVRAVDGTYAPGGIYYRTLHVELRPDVPASHLWAFGLPALSLVNSLAIAFLAHYNACKYYRELKFHSPARFARVTGAAMGICALVFGVSIVAGFQTFGGHSQAVILRNYSREDVLFTIARLAVGFSLIASYPLMFSGLREALVELLRILWPAWGEQLELVLVQDCMSLAAVVLITVCAMLLEDAGIVVGLVGAICGSAIIYVIPCALFFASLQSRLVDEQNFLIQRGATVFLALLGFALMIAGTITTF